MWCQQSCRIIYILISRVRLSLELDQLSWFLTVYLCFLLRGSSRWTTMGYQIPMSSCTYCLALVRYVKCNIFLLFMKIFNCSFQSSCKQQHRIVCSVYSEIRGYSSSLHMSKSSMSTFRMSHRLLYIQNWILECACIWQKALRII